MDGESNSVVAQDRPSLILRIFLILSIIAAFFLTIQLLILLSLIFALLPALSTTLSLISLYFYWLLIPAFIVGCLSINFGRSRENKIDTLPGHTYKTWNFGVGIYIGVLATLCALFALGFFEALVFAMITGLIIFYHPKNLASAATPVLDSNSISINPKEEHKTIVWWVKNILLLFFSISLGLYTLIGLSSIIGNDIEALGAAIGALFFSCFMCYPYFLILKSWENRISSPAMKWIFYIIFIIVSVGAFGLVVYLNNLSS
jgi:hypothetical protein